MVPHPSGPNAYYFPPANLIYRLFPGSSYLGLRIAHGFLQATAIIFVGLGIYAVYFAKSHAKETLRLRHFVSTHSWVGLATVTFVACQVSAGDSKHRGFLTNKILCLCELFYAPSSISSPKSHPTTQFVRQQNVKCELFGGNTLDEVQIAFYPEKIRARLPHYQTSHLKKNLCFAIGNKSASYSTLDLQPRHAGSDRSSGGAGRFC